MQIKKLTVIKKCKTNEEYKLKWMCGFAMFERDNERLIPLITYQKFITLV